MSQIKTIKKGMFILGMITIPYAYLFLVRDKLIKIEKKVDSKITNSLESNTNLDDIIKTKEESNKTRLEDIINNDNNNNNKNIINANKNTNI